MFMICSHYLKQWQGEEAIISKTDFWAVVALGTQLTLAAIVQLTVL